MVIALVPLTCSSRDLQKMPWCPCPFKNQTCRPADITSSASNEASKQLHPSQTLDSMLAFPNPMNLHNPPCSNKPSGRINRPRNTTHGQHLGIHQDTNAHHISTPISMVIFPPLLAPGVLRGPSSPSCPHHLHPGCNPDNHKLSLYPEPEGEEQGCRVTPHGRADPLAGIMMMGCDWELAFGRVRLREYNGKDFKIWYGRGTHENVHLEHMSGLITFILSKTIILKMSKKTGLKTSDYPVCRFKALLDKNCPLCWTRVSVPVFRDWNFLVNFLHKPITKGIPLKTQPSIVPNSS